MDKYLRENFIVEKLEPLTLAQTQNKKWSIGAILGNSASSIGLGSQGIKPTYYLYDKQTIIRYTKDEHLEYHVTDIKDGIIHVREVSDAFTLENN